MYVFVQHVLFFCVCMLDKRNLQNLLAQHIMITVLKRE